MTAYAFKCKNCGHLAEAGEAGERHLPAACRICGSGVHFDPATGAKQYDDDNWLVLADLTAKQLKEVTDFHGDIAIEQHKAAPSYPEGKTVDAEVADGLGTVDQNA
jgi:DNA mismatch repair protein MutH